ncbi:hypothetical protein D8674_039374 [Pyrus ussuriensis x Pyrus communis]|uniref:Uncharacterized protein n=1 Tax=Pyrus ussuriensis x Pyrus communis TaxID=2448454 RepID=A0A5N5H2M9_9ROSA|nr:hypothetical protein D8674_039374 [Pyrus ussuriensis x Pyrus communis]
MRGGGGGGGGAELQFYYRIGRKTRNYVARCVLRHLVRAHVAPARVDYFTEKLWGKTSLILCERIDSSLPARLNFLGRMNRT